MLAHRTEESTELARRAIALSTAAGATAVLSHALTNLGIARWQSGDRDGINDLQEAVRVALSIDDVEDACRAYVGIVWCLLDEFRLDDAEPFMTDALELSEHAEFIGFLAYLQGCRARMELARSHWEAAVAAAELPARAQPAAQCVALTVLGTIRARRGEAGATELLEQARRVAEQIDELQRIGPETAARCEHAALRGDSATVIDIAEPVFAEAIRRRHRVGRTFSARAASEFRGWSDAATRASGTRSPVAARSGSGQGTPERPPPRRSSRQRG